MVIGDVFNRQGRSLKFELRLGAILGVHKSVENKGGLEVTICDISFGICKVK